MADLAALAERLDTAARSATAITQITNEVDLNQTDAYEIGGLVVGRRLARGEKRDRYQDGAHEPCQDGTGRGR